MRHEAIREIYPNIGTICDVQGVFDIDGNPVEVDEVEVQKVVDRLTKENKLIQYKNDRAPRYPLIADQLDDLFHQGAFSKEMTEKIQKVKTKWPKDNSGPIN